MRKFVMHFDELQHASQFLAEKDAQDLANMLKDAMDVHRVTLILTGIETLGPFLDHDPQMVPRRVEIFDMPALAPVNFPEIQRTINGYAEKANIGVSLGAAEDMPDFHARLSHAALNAFGYCCRFILWALEVALYSNATVLTREHFATAYARRTGKDADSNPFIAVVWWEIDCGHLWRKDEIEPVNEPAARDKGGKKK